MLEETEKDQIKARSGQWVGLQHTIKLLFIKEMYLILVFKLQVFLIIEFINSKNKKTTRSLSITKRMINLMSFLSQITQGIMQLDRDSITHWGQTITNFSQMRIENHSEKSSCAISLYPTDFTLHRQFVSESPNFRPLTFKSTRISLIIQDAIFSFHGYKYYRLLLQDLFLSNHGVINLIMKASMLNQIVERQNILRKQLLQVQQITQSLANKQINSPQNLIISKKDKDQNNKHLQGSNPSKLKQLNKQSTESVMCLMQNSINHQCEIIFKQYELAGKFHIMYKIKS